MDAYRDKDWQTVVDNLEEALRLFNTYENSTLLCLQQCNENGEQGNEEGGREGGRT